jgi:hypothetical protein
MGRSSSGARIRLRRRPHNAKEARSSEQGQRGSAPTTSRRRDAEMVRQVPLQWPVDPIAQCHDGADRANISRSDKRKGLQHLFARVHELFREGWSVADFARHLGVNRRRIDK